MPHRSLFTATLLAVVGTSTASAQTELSLGARMATHGPGLEAAVRTQRIGLRVGSSFFSWTYKQKASSVKFEAELTFKGRAAILDYYLSPGGSFHLSGGVSGPPVEMLGVGRPALNHTFILNGRVYHESEVGALVGTATWPDLSPYVGLGWHGAMGGDRVRLTLDIGAAIGDPDITLTASNAAAGSQLESDVAAERDEIQHDVDKYAKVYPVIAMGLRVRL